jgi:hypothetical protein
MHARAHIRTQAHTAAPQERLYPAERTPHPPSASPRPITRACKHCRLASIPSHARPRPSSLVSPPPPAAPAAAALHVSSSSLLSSAGCVRACACARVCMCACACVFRRVCSTGPGPTSPGGDSGRGPQRTNSTGGREGRARVRACVRIKSRWEGQRPSGNTEGGGLERSCVETMRQLGRVPGWNPGGYVVRAACRAAVEGEGGKRRERRSPTRAYTHIPCLSISLEGVGDGRM